MIWNQLGGGTFETPKSIGAADRGYDPAFSRNRALSVVPQFADEKNFDFHLSEGSPLLSAGIAIADAEWGSTVGPADLGAFGIAVSKPASGPTDPAMELARAGDYEAAAKAVSARTDMPHALAVEAALLRAAFDEPAAAAVLARMGSPAAGDLMARFERVRQGTADPALWDLLAANPERLLEIGGSVHPVGASARRAGAGHAPVHAAGSGDRKCVDALLSKLLPRPAGLHVLRGRGSAYRGDPAHQGSLPAFSGRAAGLPMGGPAQPVGCQRPLVPRAGASECGKGGGGARGPAECAQAAARISGCGGIAGEVRAGNAACAEDPPGRERPRARCAVRRPSASTAAATAEFAAGDRRDGVAPGRVRRYRRRDELLHSRQIPEREAGERGARGVHRTSPAPTGGDGGGPAVSRGDTGSRQSGRRG